MGGSNALTLELHRDTPPVARYWRTEDQFTSFAGGVFSDFVRCLSAVFALGVTLAALVSAPDVSRGELWPT
jgi:hypothetical protein